jgi:hypothetical protein
MTSLPRPFRRTLGEFAFQLVTIIAGILIALWVDGVVEARRDRALVRNAHAALEREIASNLRSLSGALPALDKHEGQLRVGLRLAEDLLTRKKTDVKEFQLQLEMPSLNRASWQAAERTGALALMDFADTQAFAEIYELQDFVIQRQRQQVDRVADVTARFGAGPGGDPWRMGPSEVEAFRSRVLDAIGSLTVHRSLVTQLEEAYKKAPKRQP